MDIYERETRKNVEIRVHLRKHGDERRGRRGDTKAGAVVLLSSHRSLGGTHARHPEALCCFLSEHLKTSGRRLGQIATDAVWFTFRIEVDSFQLDPLSLVIVLI